MTQYQTCILECGVDCELDIVLCSVLSRCYVGTISTPLYSRNFINPSTTLQCKDNKEHQNFANGSFPCDLWPLAIKIKCQVHCWDQSPGIVATVPFSINMQTTMEAAAISTWDKFTIQTTWDHSKWECSSSVCALHVRIPSTLSLPSPTLPLPTPSTFLVLLLPLLTPLFPLPFPLPIHAFKNCLVGAGCWDGQS